MTSDYKVLGQSNPTAANLTDCYTVPASIQAVVSSVIITNRSGTPTSFRISVAPAGVADSDEQYLAYDADISGNDVVDFTIGMTLDTTDVVRVYATDATLSFNVFGEEIGGSGGGGGGFAIGSSFLLATNAGADNVASGSPVAVPWTLDTSAGADIAIDGGDNTKINIVTTGWYSVYLRAELYAELDPNGLRSASKQIIINASGNLASALGNTAGLNTINAKEDAAVIPARSFTAGDVLGGTLVASADTTWGYASVEFAVVRLS